MKRPRVKLTEEDLLEKPMLRLKMLYAYPKDLRITRAKLIERIKEKRLPPYDYIPEKIDVLSKEELLKLTWHALVKLANIEMKAGVRRQDLVKAIIAQRGLGNGSTDSTDNYNPCD